MIPEFDENGNLPPGVYFCDWEEFKERFGYTPKRSRMIEGLEEIIEHLMLAFLTVKLWSINSQL